MSKKPKKSLLNSQLSQPITFHRAPRNTIPDQEIRPLPTARVSLSRQHMRTTSTPVKPVSMQAVPLQPIEPQGLSRVSFAHQVGKLPPLKDSTPSRPGGLPPLKAVTPRADAVLPPLKGAASRTDAAQSLLGATSRLNASFLSSRSADPQPTDAAARRPDESRGVAPGSDPTVLGMFPGLGFPTSDTSDTSDERGERSPQDRAQVAELDKDMLFVGPAGGRANECEASLEGRHSDQGTRRAGPGVRHSDSEERRSEPGAWHADHEARCSESGARTSEREGYRLSVQPVPMQGQAVELHPIAAEQPPIRTRTSRKIEHDE